MTRDDLHAALLDVTQRENALVVAGAWEGLAALDAERRELLTILLEAPRPTAPQHDVLTRTYRLQAQTTELLAAQVSDLRRALGHVAKGRDAVQGYRGGGPASGGRVDLSG